MKTIDEMIEVMQAYRDGKPVEGATAGCENWGECPDPAWQWASHDYRIAVTKPSIDWSHVAPRYRWVAVDHYGNGHLFTDKPGMATHGWFVVIGKHLFADGFSSFTRGTCNWRDSLVERPEPQQPPSR